MAVPQPLMATSERVKDLIYRSARNGRKLQESGEAETGAAGTQPVEEWPDRRCAEAQDLRTVIRAEVSS